MAVHNIHDVRVAVSDWSSTDLRETFVTSLPSHETVYFSVFSPPVKHLSAIGIDYRRRYELRLVVEAELVECDYPPEINVMVLL